jgi:hypothetical protein
MLPLLAHSPPPWVIFLSGGHGLVREFRSQPGNVLGAGQLLKNLEIGLIDAFVAFLELLYEADVFAVPVSVDL